MISIALIGFGRWGKNYLNTLKNNRYAKITTLVLRPHSMNWFDPQINSFKCFSEIDSINVDAAIVAIHPESNIEVCSQLIEKKIPFLIEKPITLSLNEYRLIKEKASNAQINFMVNYQHLHSEAYQKIIQEVIDQDLNSICTIAGNYGPFRSYSALWDYGPHDLAMIYGLVGNEMELIKFNNEINDKGSNHIFELSYKNTIITNSKIWNNNLPKRRYLEVTTSKNKYVYDDLLLENKLKKNGVPINLKNTLPLNNSIEAFLRMVDSTIEKKENTINVKVNNEFILKTIEEISTKLIK